MTETTINRSRPGQPITPEIRSTTEQASRNTSRKPRYDNSPDIAFKQYKVQGERTDEYRLIEQDTGNEMQVE